MSTSTALAPVPTSSSPRRAAVGASLTALAYIALATLVAQLRLHSTTIIDPPPVQAYLLRVASVWMAPHPWRLPLYGLVEYVVTVVVFLAAVGALAGLSARRFAGRRRAQFFSTWLGVLGAILMSFVVSCALLLFSPPNVAPGFSWARFLTDDAVACAGWALAVGWLIALVAVRVSSPNRHT